MSKKQTTLWRYWLLLKFPTLDLCWPASVQEAWWRTFWLLLAFGQQEARDDG